MEAVSSNSLYVPSMEHDSCGTGFVAHLKGEKSHGIITDAITMLENMEHRGACGCEPETGDGAGILFQTPDQFLREECALLGIALPEFGQYGVGMLFFSSDEVLRQTSRQLVDGCIDELGFERLGYRPVPVNPAGVGPSALATQPRIEQVFVRLKSGADPATLERKLFVLKNRTTHLINRALGNSDDFYIVSFSHKILIYKGQLRTLQLRGYYPDLRDERVVSALALIHSRFSTNTVPKWKLAQPFRYLAHNGEINTIRGNVNWMKSKEAQLASSLFTPEEMDLLHPICNPADSDSANLDSLVELLVLSGRSLPHAMMMLIPEAWQENTVMDDTKRAFYEYHASLMEPWDGPASVCFTDGHLVGATLDRNGLRPSRYCLTTDDRLIMASEAGALPVDQAKVRLKGRLQPGRMFVADLAQGRIISDEEIKRDICARQPYRQWLDENQVHLDDLPESFVATEPRPEGKSLVQRQLMFGYTAEDLKMILQPMAEGGKEPVGSMGADTPLAVLSNQSQHLSNYFKQLFAQVSNPPIDPIRERLVMSLFTGLGPELNLLAETPAHCKQIQVTQPVLTNRELDKLKYIHHPDFRTKVISTVFAANDAAGTLEAAVDAVCHQAEEAVGEGYNLLILSDRAASRTHAPIPSLLAIGAVHRWLIKKRIRAEVGLVVEAGDARETHHFATLLGYGASAVNPYVAFQTIAALGEGGKLAGPGGANALDNYVRAVGHGLLKVFSKMGISTLQSYQGAQIFEILGLNSHVVEKCFFKTVSRIEGLDFDGIARESLTNHRLAYPAKPILTPRLEVGGFYQWKRTGEFHLFNPETIHLLQHSTKRNDYQIYQKYARTINHQVEKACTLRGLLEFKPRQRISLAEVEPKEAIFQRFATGAMSFGSISHEAHTTLAIAMNRIGGKSNSGEGGEDEIRFERKANGDLERSAIP
ncbi:MAG: hypothetical protein H7Z75_00505 [Ferruginibacter sp.]|nr:hypothetical protein [Cytophagales bacterium]